MSCYRCRGNKVGGSGEDSVRELGTVASTLWVGAYSRSSCLSAPFYPLDAPSDQFTLNSKPNDNSSHSLNTHCLPEAKYLTHVPFSNLNNNPKTG